ncbi:hypothetical protein ACSBR2_006712 [Camellia fascicularis]
MAKTSNNGKPLVHIKCCFNNKYLVREAENKWWIVVGMTNQRKTNPNGSEDFDENWCDIYTLIDCESVLSTPTSSMLAREEMALLSGTVVLKSNHNHKYLRYIHEYGPVHRFSDSPQRSNKCFVRKSANDSWIVAGADEPEEDRSKWSCTLFEPFYVDNDDDNDDAQTVRFHHIQLGCYACLWREATPCDLCLCAGSPVPDKDQCDVYTIIDWESLLVLPPKDEAFTIENMTLPRFAVLKSNFNDKCLHYIHEDGEVHGFLQFSGEQVSSQYSKYELEKANTSSNGNELLGKYAGLMRVTSAKSSCLYTASTELDKDQYDVFTIINWEMLSLVQPKSNAFTIERVALPRFVVIKSNYNGKYLRYIHEDGFEHEFVQFFGEEFVSPYTKYEVVMAKTNGGRGSFVHQGCCYNNKYLVKRPSMHHWIVAGVDEPEEDQKQWSCTLFEPLYENVVA